MFIGRGLSSFCPDRPSCRGPHKPDGKPLLSESDHLEEQKRQIYSWLDQGMNIGYRVGVVTNFSGGLLSISRIAFLWWCNLHSDFDPLDRVISLVLGLGDDFVDHLHALNCLPENGVFAIEARGIGDTNKEL